MAATARPRIDLHRHLEGALREATVLELAQRDGHPTLRDADSVAAGVSVDGPVGDLLTYLARLETATATLRTLDDVRRVALEAVEDADADDLDHVELRFSPAFVGRFNGLHAADVTAAVLDGVAAGRAATGRSVSLIGILSRTYGPEATAAELEAILAHRDGIRGIDLAGDEQGFPSPLFADQIDAARAAGLRVTLHAGEAAGPASVWETLEHLRPERIGHGVRSLEDPRLCERLARDGVVLEIAITSNVHTGACGAIATHQARGLLEAGVRLTINTDNPTVSRTWLSREIGTAAPAAGLRQAEIAAAARTAAEAAFVDDDTRARLVALADAPVR